MNGIGQVGISVTIEVNYDPGLFVGMTVYDDSGGSPVQIGSIISMLNVVDTLYRAKYTPTQEKSFIFRKAVYTDGTFTTLDNNYSRASESLQVLDIAGVVLNAVLNNYQNAGSVGQAITAAGQATPNVIGYIEPLGVPIIDGTIEYGIEIEGDV